MKKRILLIALVLTLLLVSCTPKSIIDIDASSQEGSSKVESSDSGQDTYTIPENVGLADIVAKLVGADSQRSEFSVFDDLAPNKNYRITDETFAELAEILATEPSFTLEAGM